jgi:ribonuclease HI
MFNVTISTDGACSGNPGPGGFAAVMRCGNNTKEIAGFESQTTNNRMELRAVIEGVAILKKQCSVIVRTDSHIVCNAIANIDEMPAKGWLTKTGAKRANCDLLQQLYKVKHDLGHEIRYQYVKGHDGDPDNERCDALAKEQIKLHMR